jgi:hypothetical protein
MSKILKRPMFRVGGSVNDGIMSMAAPRKNYQEGSAREQRLMPRGEENVRFLEKFLGPGPSVSGDLGDLLISGGLNLLSGRGAGKGNLGAIAESFKEPYQTFSKARAGEEALKRQIRLTGATQAMTTDEALELAKIKAAGEERFQKEFSPERKYYETYKELTDPGKKQAFGDSIQQEYPEAFAEFIAYVQPSITRNPQLRESFIGTIPSRKEGTDRSFQFDQMIAGGIYFKPDTKKLYQRDPEKNILIEYDPYSGKMLREVPLKK